MSIEVEESKSLVDGDGNCGWLGRNIGRMCEVLVMIAPDENRDEGDADVKISRIACTSPPNISQLSKPCMSRVFL